MITNQVTYNSHGANSFSIKVIPAPILIRIFYLFLIFVSIVAPLFSIVLVINSGEGIKFGNIIGLILSGIVALFLIRTFLWNTYGTEEYRIHNDKLLYIADYKFFKDGKKELELSSINVQIEEIETQKIGRLIFYDETIEFNSAVKASVSELHELKNWIKQKYT